MRFGLRFVSGAVAALALVGAAHAADLDVTVGSGGGIRQDVVEYGYGGPYGHGPGWQPGWRDRGFHGWPGPWRGGWARPAFAGPAWAYGGGCRVIVRERMTPWGERVVRRIEVCD